METTGPDVKRPRLNYDGPPSRMSSQQHAPPPSPAHNTSGILPAPSAYPGPHQQHAPPPPPSPFSHDGQHDTRSVPVEPTVHSFVQHHSGQNTPRDGRFQHELSYSRRGSASAAPRSPDDHHFPPPRSMSVAGPSDAPHYPVQYSAEPTGHLVGYQAPDPHINGNMPHGLPIHPHSEGGPPMAPGQYPEYGQPSMHPGQHQYPVQYGGPVPQAQMRVKKGNRAQQACDVCRMRKAKCDEGRPRCGFCVENDMQCNYQNVAPAKVDRANQQIIDQLQQSQEDIKMLKDEFGAKLERILTVVSSKDGRHSLSKVPVEDSEIKPTLRQLEGPGGHVTIGQGGPSNMLASPGTREAKSVVDASPSGSFNTNLSDPTGLDHVKLNKIAAEHNTAAQKLFRWPSIKGILEKSRLTEAERDENFVMNFELRKGPLRLYGRGHGQEPGESSRGVTAGASPAVSNASTSDEGSSPASSADSQWGYGINPYISEPRAESGLGGLTPTNALKLDSRTMDALLKSYLMHMHILHPLIDESKLTRMMENFKRKYNLIGAPAGNATLDALRDPVTGFARPAKRKASDGQYFATGNESNSAPVAQTPSSPLLERSPTTAMVLLVLALGKICEHREPLPGPVPSSTKEPFAYPGRSSSPQPGGWPQSPSDSASMRRSPSSSAHSVINASAPSPIGLLRQTHRSPRSSVGDVPAAQVRNLDVIPGLAYYAQATDILGNLTGSTSLEYVQCCLLAGLYSGQLANSIESIGWIQNAGRTIYAMFTNDPLRRTDRKAWTNPYRLAYHTASQLETDILAEIDLPRVGLEKVGTILYPDDPSSPAFDSQPTQIQQTTYGEIMQSYSFQLHIRGILNSAQVSLYGEGLDINAAAHRPTVTTLDDMLREFRARLPEDLKWEDNDPPATGINSARIRGKYYGGKYIVHRPFLHKALELDEDGSLDGYMQRKHSQAGTMPPPPKEANDANEDNDRNLKYIIDAAKTTIEVAQLSTLAFDGYSDHRRLTVTNILGTSHAQFGNMLVLSAVYCSKHLRQYIADDPAARMEFLFRRTINMLKNLKPISATLGHDQYILECVREVVLNRDDIQPTAPASFSSS